MRLRLASVVGLVVFVGLAWLCSSDRKRFPWRTVLVGFALQFSLGWVILRTEAGQQVFALAQLAVRKLGEVANEGAKMVFGPLADEAFLAERWGPENAVIFAVLVTATVIVVASLSSLLYHWGLLQRVVQGIAWVMRRVMRTSGSETLSAAANIFMGQTEAPLLVRPYLSGMTRSELMAVMAGGMATIAGGVAVVYAALGVDAGHLLCASVMNAPAALMLAKIMVPETERSQTADGMHVRFERASRNSLDALCRGASDGMTLALNVMAMLMAFVAVVALANLLLVWPQAKLGVDDPVTWQRLVGWLNAPVAWLLGIPPADCAAIGQVLGERIVLNEFLGYVRLTGLEKSGELAEGRSFVLATYALCGFANFTSVAIQIGGIGALVPERRQDLAQLGLRAMLAGLLACYLSAAVASLLM